MARRPAAAPGLLGAWLRRAGRIAASNQRLLFFPIALQIATSLLVLPLVLATRSGVTFDVYARDAVVAEERIVDVLDGSLPGDVVAALAVAFVGGVLFQAWLSGAFIRSIGDGDVRWWPGTRAFAALAALYTITNGLVLGLVALSQSDTYGPLAIPGILAVQLPTLFADYAIVLEGRSLAGGIERSVRVVGARIAPSLLAVLVLFTAFDLVTGLFVEPIRNADGVFTGFFGAFLLVQALVGYGGDCLLIALLLETPAPASGRGSAGPAGS